MPAASRVQLVPPDAWDEARLVDAVRALKPTGEAVRPGDALGELVVVAVEPEPGASVEDDTEMDVLASPRSADAALVDLAIMLDVSESMGSPWDAHHTRLSAACESLASFLENPGASVAEMSVFECGKEARLVAGPAPPSKGMLGDEPKPRGGSATGATLDAVLAHLAGRTRADRAQVVLLLTDGIGDMAETLAAAERARRLRVPVHSLVFAPDVDDAFAALAERSAGSVQQASYPLTIEFEHQPGGA